MDFFFHNSSPNFHHLLLIIHYSSLITHHLSLITYYLKYLNFPKHTRLALITQFCHYFLFKKKKIEKSCIAARLCFKKKKKSQTLRLNSERVVSLITKMPLKTKLWKLKTQCVFSFHNSSLKNQRIEGWKQKLGTKSKWTSQPWASLFLSYELWKQSSKQPLKVFGL